MHQVQDRLHSSAFGVWFSSVRSLRSLLDHKGVSAGPAAHHGYPEAAWDSA